MFYREILPVYFVVGMLFGLVAVLHKGPNQPDSPEGACIVFFISLFFWLPITLFLFHNRITRGTWDWEN